MIFLYLGIEVLRNNHEWNTGFVLWSTFYCLVFRFVGQLVLTLYKSVRSTKRPVTIEEEKKKKLIHV